VIKKYTTLLLMTIFTFSLSAIKVSYIMNIWPHSDCSFFIQKNITSDLMQKQTLVMIDTKRNDIIATSRTYDFNKHKFIPCQTCLKTAHFLKFLLVKFLEKYPTKFEQLGCMDEFCSKVIPKYLKHQFSYKAYTNRSQTELIIKETAPDRTTKTKIWLNLSTGEQGVFIPIIAYDKYITFDRNNNTIALLKAIQNKFLEKYPIDKIKTMRKEELTSSLRSFEKKKYLRSAKIIIFLSLSFT